jgi:hypothetical protein
LKEICHARVGEARKTGIQKIFNYLSETYWIPAYAGMTEIIVIKKIDPPKVDDPDRIHIE